jgi:hypothetical protein
MRATVIATEAGAITAGQDATEEHRNFRPLTPSYDSRAREGARPGRQKKLMIRLLSTIRLAILDLPGGFPRRDHDWIEFEAHKGDGLREARPRPPSPRRSLTTCCTKHLFNGRLPAPDPIHPPLRGRAPLWGHASQPLTAASNRSVAASASQPTAAKSRRSNSRTTRTELVSYALRFPLSRDSCPACPRELSPRSVSIIRPAKRGATPQTTH